MILSRKHIVAAAFFAACLLARPTFAGPPFITDDPEPVDLHHWEFYTFGISNYSSDSHSSDNFIQGPAIEINYGALPDMQLHLVFGGAYDKATGDNAQYGFSDTELGIKYRFIHETDVIPQVGFFPLVELPTGDADRGLGNGRAQFFLPVWLQKSWGEENHEWTTFAGGGFWINEGEGNKDFWRLGWEVQHDLGEHLTLGGEIFHETSAAEGDSGHTAFNLGGYYNFDDHNHLLFSAGRDINGPTQFTCYLGYQFTF